MDELHPLEKNVYALGLLFSGKKEQAINVQSQVFQRRMWSELNKL
jgi:hypothetical protein